MSADTLLIVIVDDQAHDRVAVRRQLAKDETHRYRFIEADDAGRGLDAIEQACQDVACVLLSHQLPDLPAADVLKALLSESGVPACPVVVLTESDSDRMAADVLSAGAQDYISKSKLTADSLRRVIHNAMARHALALKLRDSEERLRMATSAARTGIWDWDVRSGAMKWTLECYAIVGLAPMQFGGTVEAFMQLIHRADLEYVEGNIQRALGEHRQCACEFRIERRDGEVRWVSSRGQAIYDRDGNPERILGTMTDITERKQAEDRLRRNAEQVNLLARVGEFLILGARSERETLETVFAMVAGAVGAEMYFNYEPHDEASIRLSTWGGLSDDERAVFATMRYGELLCGRVATSRKPIIVEDIAHTDVEGSEAVRAAGYGAYAGFPLMAGDRLLGTIAFITRQKRFFFPGEIQTIRIVCDQVAATLERFRLDRLVRAAEERQRLALEGADLGSWDVDLRTGTTAWNRRQSELMGHDPDVGPASIDLWRQRVHPDDVERVMAEIERAQRTRNPVTVEHRVRVPGDTEVRWISLYGRYTYDEDGHAVRFSGVSRDITGNKQSQSVLQEGEQRLSVTLAAGKMGTWSWDMREDKSIWNSREYELLGLPVGEDPTVPTGLFFRHVHPADAAALQRSIAGVTTAQPDWQFEFRIIRADGQVRWLAGSGRAFFGPDAKADRMIGVNFDITERKQAEAGLQDSEARFRKVYEHSATAIAITDLQGRFKACNPAYCALTGYSEEELKLIKGPALMHPEDRQANLAGIARLLSGDAAQFEVENRYVRKDGAPVWVHKLVSVLPDAAGRPEQLLALLTDITWRRSAEQALRDREQQLRLAMDAANAGTWRVRPQTGEFFASERALTMHGVPAGTPMNHQRALACVHPEDRHLVEAGIRRAVETGAPFKLEIRVRHPDRSLHWISSTAERVTIDGQPQLFGFVQDITERKLTEERLRQSEEFTRTILENSPDCVKVMDAQGRVQYMNARGLSLMEIDTFDTVRNRCWWEWLSVEAQEPVRAAVARASRGETVQFQVFAPTQKGVPKWWDIVVAPVETAMTPKGVIAVSRDITASKHAEEALLASQANFRLLADNMGPLAWMADAQGSVYWYNKRWFDYTGTTLDEVRGWDWKGVHHPEHVERVAQRVQHSWDTGDTWEDIFPLRGRDGQYRWFLSRAVPIRDSAGQVERWFGTHTDITELRNAEAALKEADRRKDEFLAVLAHELRNPLAPIRNGIALLRAQRDDYADSTQILAILERQVTHLTRLVDDLLDVSRVSSGKLELRLAPIDLREAVQSAVEASRPLIDSQRHRLDIDLPDRPLPVEGDLVRLTQVFSNLLNNAARYTPAAGHIVIRARQQDAAIAVSVEDDGIGIAPGMLAHIFEPFRQVSDSARPSDGLGLGLALSRSIVDLHRGAIHAESAGEGSGARFVVSIPASRMGTSAMPTVEITHGSNRARRVLIVDDNVDAAETLSMLLAHNGHEVEVAHDGEVALKTAATESFDIIVLDIGMPGMDGYRVARELSRLRNTNTPAVIAVTGYGQPADRRKSNEAGFHAHLVKPVDLGELEMLIEQLAQRPEQ